jgi:tetratricopeptide (TPR) repeat protein
MKRFVYILAFVLTLTNFVNADTVLLSVSNDVVRLKYDDAIVKLENAISEKPNNLVYYPTLVELLFKKGNLDLSKKYIDMMEKYSPKGDTTLIYKMEYLRITKNIEGAFNIAKELISRPSVLTNQDFLVFYSRLLSERNLVSAKVSLYKYLQVYPNNYKLNLEMARVLMSLGELPKAKERLDYSLSLNRFNKEVYSLYGEYFFLTKDYNKSIDNLLKAVTFPEVNYREYYLLLECYYRIGKFPEALKYADLVVKDDRTKVMLMYLNKDYNSILKKYVNSKDGVIKFFAEESSIALDPDFRTKSVRMALSDSRYKDSIKLRKQGTPYIDLYYRRAIRLNPENYNAWYDLINYYIFSYSKHFAFDELLIARNILVNDERLQNMYNSLSSYVSNVSVVNKWDIDLESINKDRIFVNFQLDESIVSTNSFIGQIQKWAWESVKIPYFSFTTEGKKVNFSMLDRSYSLVLVSKIRQVGDYLKVDIDAISPINYSRLTNVSISVSLNDDVILYLSYLISYNLRTLLLGSYGKVLGSENNDKVVGVVMNGKFNLGDKVLFTDVYNYSSVPLKKYKIVAEGTIIDKDGEFVLIQLDSKYRYLTRIFNKTVFLK